jgi:GTP pyrophosphokinase
VTDTTSNSLRSRLPRIFAKAGAYNSELQAVIRSVKANHPKADVSIIEKSFVAAE